MKSGHGGTPAAAVAGVPFVKGHGTENDFILLPDPDGTLEVTPAQVRALCDRRAGLGADGVIRVVRGGGPAGGDFFMDYRNADGSLAQMCGNGARVFARFLVDDGWAEPGRLLFATHGGLRSAAVPPVGDITIRMGPARVGGGPVAGPVGHEIPGVAVDVGNPHLVCLTEVDLRQLDLSTQPDFDPEVFTEGVNIEFVSCWVRTGSRCGCTSGASGRPGPVAPAQSRWPPLTWPRPVVRWAPSQSRFRVVRSALPSRTTTPR